MKLLFIFLPFLLLQMHNLKSETSYKSIWVLVVTEIILILQNLMTLLEVHTLRVLLMKPKKSIKRTKYNFIRAKPKC